MVLDPNDPNRPWKPGMPDPDAPPMIAPPAPPPVPSQSLTDLTPPPTPGTPAPQPDITPGLMPPPAGITPGLTPPPDSSPATPQALTDFGPGNDLQGQQINPIDSARLDTTQGQVDTAAGKVAGFSGYTPYQAVGTGDQSGVKSLQDQAAGNIGGASITAPAGFQSDTGGVRSQLAGLTSGIGSAAPDRKSIALDALKTFDEQQANAEKTGIQRIGRANAAAGRLGSGMASTDIGNLESDLNQQRLQMERGLAGDVASQSLADKLAAVSGTSGALGQLGGLDLSKGSQDLAASGAKANLALAKGGAQQSLAGQQFEQGATGRNEARADQANNLAVEQANQGAKTGAVNTLAGLESQQAGQEAAKRGEVRGERGYQAGADQQALENRIRQRALEDSLQTSALNRNVTVANAENQAAGDYADQSAGANAGVQDLLSSYALQQYLAQHPELRGAA